MIQLLFIYIFSWISTSWISTFSIKISKRFPKLSNFLIKHICQKCITFWFGIFYMLLHKETLEYSLLIAGGAALLAHVQMLIEDK